MSKDYRSIQRKSFEVRRDASREYMAQRITGRVREIQRETDEEIRAAIAQSYLAMQHSGGAR